MQISPQWVLAVVGAVMFALAIKDLAAQRKITPAAKARLLLVLIFALVLAWQAWQQHH